MMESPIDYDIMNYTITNSYVYVWHKILIMLVFSKPVHY